PGDAAEADGRSRTMARAAAHRGSRPYLAGAAQPLWRTGAVGQFPAQLAGGAGSPTEIDSHDRRRYQPQPAALCRARLGGREPAIAGALAAKVRTDGELLYRQGQPVCDHRETAARSSGRRVGCAPDAAHADWARVEGTPNHLHCGAFSAGQGTGTESLWNRSGPVGEEPARSESVRPGKPPISIWRRYTNLGGKH